MKFLTTKPYTGVRYSIINGSYWERKSQVPNVRLLPTGRTRLAYTRFNSRFKWVGDDEVEQAYFTPLKEGDMYSYVGDKRGIVSKIEIVQENNGFFIRIVCEKSFEYFNNKPILIDKETSHEISMYNFIHFFSNIQIIQSTGNELTGTSLIPYYENTISELKEKVKFLESQLKAHNIAELKLTNLIDNRISTKSWEEHERLRRIEESKKPVMTKAEKEYEAKRIKEFNRSEISRIATNQRELWAEQDRYDANPNADRFCGKRPV